MANTGKIALVTGANDGIGYDFINLKQLFNINSHVSISFYIYIYLKYI